MKKSAVFFAAVLTVCTVWALGGTVTRAPQVPAAQALSGPEYIKSLPSVRKGSRGPLVVDLQTRLNALIGEVCVRTTNCRKRYKIAVDGQFGSDTEEAVLMFQAQQNIEQDGLVGPQTWLELYNPTERCEVTRQALRSVGASDFETEFGVRIAARESGCRLATVVFKHSTRDNSHGPWQINYYGKLRPWVRKTFGSEQRNTASWPSAARMFLSMMRKMGTCPWIKPYCG